MGERVIIGRYKDGPMHGWGTTGYFLRGKDGDEYYPDGPMGGYDTGFLKHIARASEVEFTKDTFQTQHEGQTVTVQPTKSEKVILHLATNRLEDRVK